MKWNEKKVREVIRRGETKHLMIKLDDAKSREELQMAISYQRRKMEGEKMGEIGIITRGMEKNGEFFLIVEPRPKFEIMNEEGD